MPKLKKWDHCKATPPELDGERCPNESTEHTHFCPEHGGLGDDGTKQCMGKSHMSGVRCNNKPEPGRMYCKFHGGNHPIGPDHHAYKHAKYATVAMPKRLAEKYAITSQDPEVMSLAEEIHIVDAMLMDSLERLETKEGADAWKRLYGAVSRFKKARADENAYDMNTAFEEIDSIVLQGSAAYAARRDLQSWLESRRKLTDSDLKRRVALGDMLSRAQTLVMIDNIVGLIQTHVKDHKARTHLSAALLNLVDPS